jgi:hypothetical protein
VQPPLSYPIAHASKVHTSADDRAESGAFIEHAVGLLRSAEELLNRAVVLERERGTSWEVIGEVFGMSRQGAQQKYGPTFDQWREALDEPLRRGRGNIYDSQLPDGPDDPERHVARLDAWLARVRESKSTPRTASGGLERASLVEQIGELARQARRIVHEKDSAKARAYHARKAAVLGQIAAAQPGNKDAAEAAALAQRELEALGEIDTRSIHRRRDGTQ